MSENTFIKKRQKERNRPFLTLRVIFGLIFVSVGVWAGFYFEYGTINDGTCEAACEKLHSMRAYVLGFFMIFAVIIAGGAAVGGLFATLRWSRKNTKDTLSTLISDDKESD